jgi:hypothetical protein
MKVAVEEADALMARDGFRPRGRTADVAIDRQLAANVQCVVGGTAGHELRAYSNVGR